MNTYDYIIVGGGIVGLAMAFGALSRGKSVLVLDGDKGDNRASFSNFGLVWVQGKGVGLPEYQMVTKASSDMWPGFAEAVEEISGVSIQYDRKGGVVFCVGEKEYETRRELLGGLQKSLDSEPDWEMLGRKETQNIVGEMSLGPDVVGASFCRRDGCVNPLLLVRALNIAIDKLGGEIVRQAKVTDVEQKQDCWEVSSFQGKFRSESVFVSAGLGSKQIADKLGFDLPIVADKGQIMVSERLPASFPLPASGLRQTHDGSFMFGATHEGENDLRSTVQSAVKLSKRATSIFPELRKIKIVRQWAGYRIMTPDTFPIYYQPAENLTFTVCHSGITLAAFHASDWTQRQGVFEQFGINRFQAA